MRRIILGAIISVMALTLREEWMFWTQLSLGALLMFIGVVELIRKK